MKQPDQPKPPSEVPTQIFERFVEALREAKIPPAAIERLRGLLLSEKALNEKGITDALLTEDQLP
jgi:hypothetical protein